MTISSDTFSIAKETQELLKKNLMTQKMFLHIVGITKISKLSILMIFEGGGTLEPSPTMLSNVNGLLSIYELLYRKR